MTIPSRYRQRKDANQGEIRIELRTVNPLNLREHWTRRCKRVQEERLETLIALRERWGTVLRPALPMTVLLTREAMRTMDTDGLAASFKGVRDEVAEWLGVDDADPRVEWKYAQRQAKGYHVCIEFRAP